MPFGIILRHTQTDDVRVIVRVAIAQQFKQIGSFDSARPFTEIFLCRNLKPIGTGRHPHWQQVWAARLIGCGLRGIVIRVLRRLEALNIHCRIFSPGRHAIQEAIGIVAQDIQPYRRLCPRLSGIAHNDDFSIR